MKKVFTPGLFLFLAILAGTTFAAELRISKSLDWQKPESTTAANKGLPVFTGFGLRDFAGEIPVFIHQLADVLPTTEATAHLENVVAVDAQAGNSLSEATSDLPLGVPTPVIHRSTSRGETQIEICFTPFIKNEDGTLMLIQSFDLVINRTENPQYILKQGTVWKESSVLAEGTWYKFYAPADGVYKITYNDLVNMGIDPAGIVPEKLGVYGSSGEMISETNKSAAATDLLPLPAELIGGSDGRFNPGDYLRFWSNGPKRWTYNTSAKRFKQNKNPYSAAIPVFLRIDDPAPARLATRNNITDAPTHQVSTFPDFKYFKPDSMSVSRTGRTWVSSKAFRSTTPRNFQFDFPNIVTTSAATLELSVASWSDKSNSFFAEVNGNQLIKITNRALVGQELNYNTAVTGSKNQSFFPEDDQFDIAVWFNMEGSNPVGYFDYLSMQAIRKLLYTDGQMQFVYSPERETQKVPEISIGNLPAGTHLWLITNPDSAANWNYLYSEEKQEGRVRMMTTLLQRFVLFNDGDELNLQPGTAVQNQNLHAHQPVDYLIIVADSMVDQAERLANLHREYSNLTCSVVPVEQVINEFGSGIFDPMAIRQFVRMQYDRGLAAGKAPRYLLLFGDGSYDPLNRIPNNQALIPTYQSLESFNLGASYVTDDFFGLLDEGEGDSAKGSLDIGIGRFPVATLAQAQAVVDKIERYLTNPPSTLSDWRNQFTFVADDEDGKTHIDQSNKLVQALDTLLNGQVINKVYLDSYVQTTTPSGNRYPDAKTALNNYVEQGCQIVNYTGHGGELGWSEEKVLEIPDIEGWNNQNQLPFFITATCEFSRFDDPGLLSGGERVLLNSHGGGIGLLTTTRLAYSSVNFNLNSALYQIWFNNNNPAEYTFGDLIRLSKNANNNDYRMRNITLLGDPALRLAYPTNRVRLTAVNGISRSSFGQILKGLDEIALEGEITTPDGSLLPTFQGMLSYKLFDKPQKVTTLANDPKSYPYDFYVTNKLLTSGKVVVENGKFNFTMIAPRDMNLEPGFPLLSFYATDSITDATGSENKLEFEGISTNGAADDQPPAINAWLETRMFQNGDIVTSSPLLIADFSDNLGINFCGLGIGHDITVVIDGETNNTLNVNEYFQPTLGDSKSGSLSLILPTMESGNHTLELKAFDINNNSSVVTLHFVVGNQQSSVTLSEIAIRPNPFVEQTAIWFTHSGATSTFTATFQVFDLSGRMVFNTTTTPEQITPTVAKIEWNGRNNGNYALNPGVYPARIILTDQDGNTVSTGLKLVKTSVSQTLR